MPINIIIAHLCCPFLSFSLSLSLSLMLSLSHATFIHQFHSIHKFRKCPQRARHKRAIPPGEFNPVFGTAERESPLIRIIEAPSPQRPVKIMSIGATCTRLLIIERTSHKFTGYRQQSKREREREREREGALSFPRGSNAVNQRR